MNDLLNINKRTEIAASMLVYEQIDTISVCSNVDTVVKFLIKVILFRK